MIVQRAHCAVAENGVHRDDHHSDDFSKDRVVDSTVDQSTTQPQSRINGGMHFPAEKPPVGSGDNKQAESGDE